MDMIEALNDAVDVYYQRHKILIDGLADCMVGDDFYDIFLSRAISDALHAEAIDKAIKELQARSLLDRASLMRYNALEFANKKIEALEKEIAELKGTSPAEHEDELYRSDVGH